MSGEAADHTPAVGARKRPGESRSAPSRAAEVACRVLALQPKISLNATSDRQNGDPVIFVFEVHVHPGYPAEAYAEAWVRASEIIQRAPGARGTRLHRKIGDPDRLLAIASWESKAARDAMEASPADEAQRIIAAQAEFVDVRVIGEFEDPDWIVEK